VIDISASEENDKIKQIVVKNLMYIPILD
jgi:hypothetical protein